MTEVIEMHRDVISYIGHILWQSGQRRDVMALKNLVTDYYHMKSAYLLYFCIEALPLGADSDS